MEYTGLAILDYENCKLILSKVVPNQDAEEAVQDYCESTGTKFESVHWMTGNIQIEW
jgi:hypothetical protein